MPGGRVALGFLPKTHMDRMNMPADIFTPREPDEVIAALRDAGFEDTELRSPSTDAACLVATAPDGGLWDFAVICQTGCGRRLAEVADVRRFASTSLTKTETGRYARDRAAGPLPRDGPPRSTPLIID